ncbi:MAG: hypothetical protein IJ832_04915 [Bacteroidaceae bacterium]|nr:hypothetical protein [Bacteroidaceae bacterium]
MANTLSSSERQELMNDIIEQIKAQALSMSDVEETASLAGVSSLPAMRGQDLVRVPVELLTQGAGTAAGKANSAAQQAKTAAGEANDAADYARKQGNAATTGVEQERSQREEADAEIMRRLQGTSAQSNAQKDPAVQLGDLSDYAALNDTLDLMLEDRDSKRNGWVKCAVGGRPIEIRMWAQNFGTAKWVQTVKGVISLSDGKLKLGTSVHEYWRKGEEGEAVTAWAEVVPDELAKLETRINNSLAKKQATLPLRAGEGDCSIESANGTPNVAAGDMALAIGQGNTAAGMLAMLLGQDNTGRGYLNVLLGMANFANMDYACCLGFRNDAQGWGSVCIGMGLKTTNEGEVAIGKYNQPKEGMVFSIGCGIDNEQRRNALEVYSDGTVKYGND